VILQKGPHSEHVVTFDLRDQLQIGAAMTGVVSSTAGWIDVGQRATLNACGEATLARPQGLLASLSVGTEKRRRTCFLCGVRHHGASVMLFRSGEELGELRGSHPRGCCASDTGFFRFNRVLLIGHTQTPSESSQVAADPSESAKEFTRILRVARGVENINFEPSPVFTR
jgi:hypothetical protein